MLIAGHSGAGIPLPAVAGATTAPVLGTIYMDALLPHPGRSWFETVPEDLRTRLRDLAADDGRLPPWDAWSPPGTVEQFLPGPATRAAPHTPGPAPGRSAYLQLSDAYATQADQTRRAGWSVTRLAPSHHLAPLTDPGELSAALTSLTTAFTS